MSINEQELRSAKLYVSSIRDNERNIDRAKECVLVDWHAIALDFANNRDQLGVLIEATALASRIFGTENSTALNIGLKNIQEAALTECRTDNSTDIRVKNNIRFEIQFQNFMLTIIENGRHTELINIFIRTARDLFGRCLDLNNDAFNAQIPENLSRALMFNLTEHAIEALHYRVNRSNPNRCNESLNSQPAQLAPAPSA